MKIQSRLSPSTRLVGRDASGSSSWAVGVACDSGLGRLFFDLTDDTGVAASFLTGSAVDALDPDVRDGNWHHVVVVRDGTADESRIYVNGTLEGSAAPVYVGGFGADGTDLNIGHLSSSFGYTGLIEEVAIYGRALTEREIRGHYFLTLDYCTACDEPVAIMNLGDSLTKGQNGSVVPPEFPFFVAYRQQLWQRLLASNNRTILCVH